MRLVVVAVLSLGWGLSAGARAAAPLMPAAAPFVRGAVQATPPLAPSVEPAGPAAADLPMCYYTTAPGTEAGVEMPRGFVIRLTRTAAPDAAEESCTVRVLAPGGAVLFERTGYGARVLPVNGQDLDGDGALDAALSVDEGGGNRCCWGTTVVRLATPAAVVVDVPFPVGWQLDPPRGAVVNQTVSFDGLGPSLAESPAITRLHRVTASGLRDVTREFCDQILSRTAFDRFAQRDVWPDLTPERRRASRARAGARSDGDAEAEVTQTRLSAMTLALQYLACGRATDADALVAEVWPAAEVQARGRMLSTAFAAQRPK